MVDLWFLRKVSFTPECSFVYSLEFIILMVQVKCQKILEKENHCQHCMSSGVLHLLCIKIDKLQREFNYISSLCRKCKDFKLHIIPQYKQRSRSLEEVFSQVSLKLNFEGFFIKLFFTAGFRKSVVINLRGKST